MSYTVKVYRWVGDDDTGHEQTIEVEGTVGAIIRGVYSGPPDRCYPDEGGEVEYVGAWLIDTDENGVETRTEFDTQNLTPEEDRDVIEKLSEAAADDDSWDDRESYRDDDYP